MPIEYSPQWTGEVESGMTQYVNTMEMIEAREAYTRWLKARQSYHDLYNPTNTDYNIWQNILAKNPNVLVLKGEEVMWGKAAADFLTNNANAMSLGPNGIMLQPQNSPRTIQDVKNRFYQLPNLNLCVRTVFRKDARRVFAGGFTLPRNAPRVDATLSGAQLTARYKQQGGVLPSIPGASVGGQVIS